MVMAEDGKHGFFLPRFPKMRDPQVTVCFNSEMVIHEMIWGYPHSRTPPYGN